MKKYLAILLVSLGFSSLLFTRLTEDFAYKDDAAISNQSAPKYTGLKKDGKHYVYFDQAGKQRFKNTKTKKSILLD